jgi:hypothetical protein
MRNAIRIFSSVCSLRLPRPICAAALLASKGASISCAGAESLRQS